MSGFGRIIPSQTSSKSIQVGFDKHFYPDKWGGGCYWIHSCDPNTYAHSRADGYANVRH